jgi:hypothetical protein
VEEYGRGIVSCFMLTRESVIIGSFPFGTPFNKQKVCFQADVDEASAFLCAFENFMGSKWMHFQHLHLICV